MSKGLKVYFAIVAILVVMVSVLAFVIPFPKKSYATFIMSFVGIIIALAAQGYVAYLMFKKSSSLRSKIYGIPVIRVSIMYLMFQFIASVVIMAVNAFVYVPVFVPVVVFVLLGGVAAIGILITSAAKGIIEGIEAQEKAKTAFMNNFKIEIESLENKTDDEAFNKDLHKLIEKVKYSDPMSANELVDVENEMNTVYLSLKDNIANKNLDEAKKDATELSDLVDKRNKLCKLNKE